MNILFMTRRFPPSIGGMERYAFDIYSALTRQPDMQTSLVKWGGKNKWLHLPILPVLFVWGFWLLLTRKIDVIHAQDGIMSAVGHLLKLIFRKPLVVVIHGLDITYKNPLFRAVIPRTVAQADKVICISTAAQDAAVIAGVPREKTVVITLGVDDLLFANDKLGARSRLVSELGLSKDAKILLSVGRLVKRKGIAWFVENVLPQLAAQDKNIVLLVSGEGSEREVIERAVKTHSLENHVQLLGRTSDTMRKDLYNGSDIFIMPNIVVSGDMEGFGLVLTEAAICELPVVAAGIEGIRDAVKDGQNGYLLDSEDAEGFVYKIQVLLQNRRELETFGKKARQYTLANYNWNSIANQFVDVYKEVSGGKRI